MTMAYVAKIILPVYLKNLFDYLIKEEDLHRIQKGKRVLVPFGRSNKIYTGIVYQIYESHDTLHELKYIDQIVDEVSIVPEVQFHFWSWIAEYYCCSLGEVMLLALPNHLIIYTQIQISFTENIQSLDVNTLTEKEKEAVDFLASNQPISYEKLKSTFSEHIIRKLLQKQIIQQETQIVNPYKPQLKTFVFINYDHLQKQFSEHKQLSPSELVSLALQNTKSENSQKVLLYLIQNQGIEKKYLLSQLKIPETVLKSLEKKSWIHLEKHAVDRIQLKSPSSVYHELNMEEKSICRKWIQEIENQKEWAPTVFFHDLGNRRIQFYIQWIKDWIGKGKQVLLLVPEIAFTDKFVMELQNHFYEELGIYHGRINDNERVEIWYKVFLKEFKIIIGVRSALFLPFSDLGLVIIDEEQDANYKQEEKNPKMNFKDAAIYYSKMLNSPIILASQTPSIETFYQTRTGKYRLVKYLKSSQLKENQIIIKDLKKENTLHQSVGLFSEYAYKAIYQQKLKKLTSVIFVNRKGYAPRIVCNACGHVHYCKNCDIALTYHKQINKLRCHYCGYQEDNIYFCKNCGSNDLIYEGLGTEKVEEQLFSIFQNFRIARLDSDNFKTRKQLADFLQSIQKNEIDIVIGTQLVTKLLHLDNIEILVVLLTDMMLHIPNFRAFEYTFQFLRHIIYDFDLPNQKNKQLILQTRTPNHKLFDYLLKDYAEYYHDQITLREELQYPPFCRLIEIEVLHPQPNRLYQAIATFDKLLKNAYSRYVLGPSIPSVSRLKNYYRVLYLIKIPKNQSPSKIKEHIQRAFQDFLAIERDKKFRISIDVDPK